MKQHMSASFLPIFSLIFSMMILSSSTFGQQKKQSPDKDKVLRHVVLLKFQDTSTPEDVSSVERAFKGLSKKISLIKDFEWGTNNSPENLNQGLTHSFLLTFRDEKDRDAYLTHPEHVAFVEIAKPHIEKVTVVDYWVKK